MPSPRASLRAPARRPPRWRGSPASQAIAAIVARRAVLRAAARRALRRVPARRGLPRRPDRRALAAAAATGRDRPASPPAGTAGIPSSSSTASACAAAPARRRARCSSCPRSSWSSRGRRCRSLDLRLKELVHRAAAARDPARPGRHAARRGHGIRPEPVGDDAPIADWLLRQPHIDVHDALITWNDDLRNAPQLVLDHVHFRLESRFGRHRFGLRGTPPAGAGRADRRARRRPPRDRPATGSRRPEGSTSGSTTPTSRRGRVAAAAGADRQRQGRAAAVGRVCRRQAAGDRRRPRAGRREGEACAPTCPSSISPACPAVPAGATRLPRHEFHTRALAFVTTGGQRLEPTDIAVTLREAARQRRRHRAGRVRPPATRAAARPRRAPAAAGARAHRARAVRAARHADPRPHPVGRARGHAVTSTAPRPTSATSASRRGAPARCRGPERSRRNDAGHGRPQAREPQRGARVAAGLRRADSVRQPRRRIQLDADGRSHRDRDRATGIREPGRGGSGHREIPDRAQRPRGDRARCAAHARQHRAGAPLPAARRSRPPCATGCARD